MYGLIRGPLHYTRLDLDTIYVSIYHLLKVYVSIYHLLMVLILRSLCSFVSVSEGMHFKLIMKFISEPIANIAVCYMVLSHKD